LFRAQTVEQLATHLRDQTSVSNGPLVKLQDGTRRPFFCVHPVGGNVLCYAELSRALGVDQTFYGIQAPPPGEPLASIEQMAHSYVDAILTVQPHGPYLLGGWSMGGLIAFEMARALERKGETVSLLALIDPTPPKSNGHVLKDDELSLLMSFARDLGLEVNQETWPTQQLEQLQTGERLSYLHDLATTKQFISPDLGLPEVSAIFEVFKRNITAIKTYKPAAHAMKTILFRAREGVRSEERDETAGLGQRGRQRSGSACSTRQPLHDHACTSSQATGRQATRVARPKLILISASSAVTAFYLCIYPQKTQRYAK
jgi:thioesterase domain-containing protein